MHDRFALRLVILAEAPDRYGEMVRLHKAVGNVGIGVDVLVYSEAEYQRRSQVPGTVLYWARKEGRQPCEAAPAVGDSPDSVE